MSRSIDLDDQDENKPITSQLKPPPKQKVLLKNKSLDQTKFALPY